VTATASPQSTLFALPHISLPKDETGLAAKAMLCWLSISDWDGFVYDRTVSEEIADIHGAEKDVGRYRKRLLPKTAFQEIKKVVNLARRRHAFFTLPWDDDNYRILPSANYFDHLKEMKQLRAEFRAAVARLENRYENLVVNHSGLGTMFKVEDYPGMRDDGGRLRLAHPEELRSRFSFEEPKVKPMPSDDFRASIGDEERQRLQNRIAEEVKATLRRGTREIWHRLYEPVSHMAKRMSEFDAAAKENKPKLFDAMITNIVAVLDVLPNLNIEGDQSLELMAEEIRRELIVDRKDIRKSEALSAHLANKTAEITRRMAAYMGIPAEAAAGS
jgi:hypothetical protein